MPKDFRIKDLKKLMEKLSLQTKESLDHYGTGRMSEKINGTISQKYLYDNLLRPLINARDANATLKLSPNKIDELAQYVGFHNFQHFIADIHNTIDPVLETLIGSYYSYVRRNARRGVLLQSPVNIQVAGNAMFLVLKGRHNEYAGELRYINGCATCIMKSPQSGKEFYHIYKLGRIIAPTVLMGIFSGISSSNDPIGGRCILVRQQSSFSDLTNQKRDIEEMKVSGNTQDIMLANYFSSFNDNNLKINIPYGFDFDDLEASWDNS